VSVPAFYGYLAFLAKKHQAAELPMWADVPQAWRAVVEAAYTHIITKHGPLCWYCETNPSEVGVYITVSKLRPHYVSGVRLLYWSGRDWREVWGPNDTRTPNAYDGRVVAWMGPFRNDKGVVGLPSLVAAGNIPIRDGRRYWRHTEHDLGSGI
jgi:hypothetical protein